MRSVYRFLKATIIGGLVVMVPVVALGAILVWATKIALEAIEPVVDRLPDHVVRRRLAGPAGNSRRPGG